MNQIVVDNNHDDIPIISIITATYNVISSGRSKDFLKLLEILSNQSEKKFEHIIIDGNSSDGTGQLFSNKLDKHGKTTFISEPDKGIYDAFNKGINASNGDYLLFLGSDDNLSSVDSIARMCEAISSSDADFIYGPVFVVNNETDTQTILRPNLRVAFTDMPLPFPGCLVSRRHLLAIGGFDITFQIAGDYDFVLKSILNGAKFKAYHEPCVNFNIGGISTISTTESILLEERIITISENFDAPDLIVRNRMKNGKLSRLPPDFSKSIRLIFSNLDKKFKYALYKNHKNYLIFYIKNKLFKRFL